MNIAPIMAIQCVNLLPIQLLKYHDNDDPILHIGQLTKGCVTNGEDIENHKIQYFPNSLKGKSIDWFAIHEIATSNSNLESSAMGIHYTI